MIICSTVLVGMLSSLAIILRSPGMYAHYGLEASAAPLKLDNPGIVSIPPSFAVLVIVSLMTPKAPTTTPA
jgi:cation/acetate symporter